jgi:uncharacterized protein involved in exopolysaccharide biosynthesis
MEIVDFLRGRWIAVLVSAPILAALLTGGAVAAVTKPGYKVTGTVAVAQAVPSTVLPIDLNLIVADFRSAVKGTGLSTSVPTGTNVQATASGDTPSKAADNLKGGVQRGLIAIATSNREQAQVDMNAAKAQLDTATASLNQLEQSAGVQDVQTEYRNRSQDLLSLRNQLAVAQSPQQAAALSSLIAQKTAELDHYGAVLNQFEQLDAQVTAADTQYQNASTTFAQAAGRVAQVTNAPLIQQSSVAKVGRLHSATKTSAAAGLVAFAAVVAAAVMARRRTAATAGSSPEINAPPAAAPERVPTPSPVKVNSNNGSLRAADSPSPGHPLRTTVKERATRRPYSARWEAREADHQ